MKIDFEDWKEMRARVDSIENAVFLIAGGALSVSLSLILSSKSKKLITPEIACIAETAWYLLLSSILLSLFLKVFVVAQAHLRQSNLGKSNLLQSNLNIVGWVIGLTGFLTFAFGLFSMVRAASMIIST